MLLLSLSIFLHLPRLLGSVDRYAGKNTNKSAQFSKNEFDNLVSNMNNKVVIDIKDVGHSLPILVELGRHENIALEWTSDAWNSILGYRKDWKAPKITSGHFWMTLNSQPINRNCTLKFKDSQYQLLKC